MQKVDSKFGVSLRFDGLELAISGGPGRKVHVSTAGDFSLQKTEVRGLINLIAENFRITQILMVDPAYSASQSIKDIELFKRYFGPNSTGSLKIESNRLPVPLERQEIVIRENPGRLIFRRGYIEGVASEMWLGRSFWPHCTSDKGKILSHEWLEATDCENFLYLRAVPECFNKEDGEEGRIQHRLLQLFFGKKNGG